MSGTGIQTQGEAGTAVGLNSDKLEPRERGSEELLCSYNTGGFGNKTKFHQVPRVSHPLYIDIWSHLTEVLTGVLPRSFFPKKMSKTGL